MANASCLVLVILMKTRFWIDTFFCEQGLM